MSEIEMLHQRVKNLTREISTTENLLDQVAANLEVARIERQNALRRIENLSVEEALNNPSVIVSCGVAR